MVRNTSSVLSLKTPTSLSLLSHYSHLLLTMYATRVSYLQLDTSYYQFLYIGYVRGYEVLFYISYEIFEILGTSVSMEWFWFQNFHNMGYKIFQVIILPT